MFFFLRCPSPSCSLNDQQTCAVISALHWTYIRARTNGRTDGGAGWGEARNGGGPTGLAEIAGGVGTLQRQYIHDYSSLASLSLSLDETSAVGWRGCYCLLAETEGGVATDCGFAVIVISSRPSGEAQIRARGGRTHPLLDLRLQKRAYMYARCAITSAYIISAGVGHHHTAHSPVGYLSTPSYILYPPPPNPGARINV